MFRALIVEDEDIMRDYLAENLHSFCPEWTAAATAADGMEAVERLAHERFDAVITDIRMPVMDGIELSRYIRAQDEDMPILILSGYDAFDYARSAMRLNVFDYLLKPINEQELAAALSAMAVQVAARNDRADSALLTQALSGDTNAVHSLAAALADKPSALLLLAPAAMADTQLDALYMAAAGLGVISTRLPDAVAVCVNADDSLLLPTMCRRAMERLAQVFIEQSVHCGCAVFLPANITIAWVQATQLLRYSLALDIPFLMEPLRMEHRQAAQKLDTMESLLQQAWSEGSLTDERCIILKNALQEFTPEQRGRVALTLLRSVKGNTSDACSIVQRLIDVPPNTLPAAFVTALQALRESATLMMPATGQLVRRARDFLQERFAQPISLSALAEQLQVNPAYLSALFHREMGCSYSQYLLRLRMEDAARKLLENADAKVQDVASAVGFVSAKHFAHVFRAYYQMTPTEYRDHPTHRKPLQPLLRFPTGKSNRSN